jgi:putative membrane protein
MRKQLIKPAYIWVLTVLLAGGIWAIAGKAGITSQSQNSNQNSNSNSNTGNANQTQNDNANRSANRNDKGGTATGEQAGMGTLNSRDRDFLMEAAIGGLMEVELGRMAAQQGASEAVKKFGQRMVDDHTQANTELMALATNKGITLPTALDDKHREHATKLSGMSGAEFDRAYVKMMVRDHSDDVKKFERQSERGADPDLKAFAAKSLPTLQEHLQMARALNDQTGGNTNSNSNSGGSGNRNSNSNSNRP